MWNPNILENMNVAAFWLGMKNYQENLSQSDKDDLIRSMSSTNEDLLQRIEADLEEQNVMLRNILLILERQYGKIES